MTTMLYKSPGKFKRSADETFDMCIVNDDELDAALKDGWHKTVPEAVEAAKPKAEVEKPKPKKVKEV